MKQFKYLFLLLAGGLMGACSSESEMPNNPEPVLPTNPDLEWVSAKVIETSVPEGDNVGEVSTRAADEVDSETKNPVATLPDRVQNLYIVLYDGKTLDSKGIKLDRADNFSFEYAIESEKDGVALNDDEVKIHFTSADRKESIVANYTDFAGGARFIFTSFDPANGTKFDLKKMDYDDNLYQWANVNNPEEGLGLFPDAYEEYHDILFSSDGIMVTKENGKFAFQTIGQNAIIPHPIVDWNLTLKRMSACITLSTVIVDHFDGNNPVNISGIDKLTDVATAIQKTNEALWQKTDFPKTLSVSDIFTRKKGLKNFPIHYDFLTGPMAAYGDTRGNVYLCNLDKPAWMEDMVDYQFGDNTSDGKFTMIGVASQCDNFPFFPSTKFEDVRGIKMLLFMGFRDRNAEIKPERQTIVAYEVEINTLTFQHNKNHYLYLAFTLEDIAKMYREFVEEDKLQQEKEKTGTRSVSEPSYIKLPSHQVIMCSEPYFSNK